VDDEAVEEESAEEAVVEPMADPQLEPGPVQAPPIEGLTLDAVDEAWPAIVAHVRDEAGPRRNALFKEARPAAVEGSTVVLAVPEHLPFHLAQLQEDDTLSAIVNEAAERVLGGAVRFEYRVGEARPEDTAPGPADDTTDGVPDRDTLVDSEEGAVDATDLVVDLLGGEVVED
jgi:hypothetical protein